MTDFTEKPQTDGGLDQRRLLRPRARGARLHRRRRHALGAATAASTLAARGPAHGLPPRGLLAADGHAAREAAPGGALGSRATRRGRCGREWPGGSRASSSPAPPGFVGSWLVRAAGRRRAPAVAVLVRDWDPQSELIRSGTVHRGLPCRRRPARGRSTTSSGRSASTRSTPSSTSARRPSSGPRCAAPLRDVRGQHPRHLQPARGLPRATRGLVKRVVRRLQRQGLRRRPRCCPTPRTCRSTGATPTTSPRAAPTCSRRAYARHLRPAGGRRPLRQHLRRRRPQLEPHRPGHDPLGPRAASARCIRCDGTLHARLPLRRRRGRRLPRARRRRRIATGGAGRGVQLQPLASRRTVLEIVDAAAADRSGGRTSQPVDPRQRPGRDPRPVPRLRRRPTSVLGWQPKLDARGGARDDRRLVPRLPGSGSGRDDADRRRSAAQILDAGRASTTRQALARSGRSSPARRRCRSRGKVFDARRARSTWSMPRSTSG